MNVCMCAHMHMTWRLYGGQRTAFGKHVSPGDWPQVVRPGGKCPYLLSHFTSPKI